MYDYDAMEDLDTEDVGNGASYEDVTGDALPADEEAEGETEYGVDIENGTPSSRAVWNNRMIITMFDELAKQTGLTHQSRKLQARGVGIAVAEVNRLPQKVRVVEMKQARDKFKVEKALFRIWGELRKEPNGRYDIITGETQLPEHEWDRLIEKASCL